MDPGKKESTHGKWLCEVFGDYNIVFVSGAVCFGPSSGKITSFQGIHRTVIDYVACSRALFSEIVSFTVADQVEGYDHAALAVSIKLDVGDSNTILERPRKKAKVDVVLPDVTELDKLFIRTLDAGKDEDKKLYALVHTACARLAAVACIDKSCIKPPWNWVPALQYFLGLDN
ncbi:hypothetical protein K438DRAFT_1764309 [Mycena galopus ATCC 62051]|nr:hypothetical protein K438DRAFT_1764309 [Mycena galopus ATCC 62051]